MTPSFELWLTLGALTGVLLAGIIPAVYLYVHFALILLLSAQQMFARRGDRASLATSTPRPPGETDSSSTPRIPTARSHATSRTASSASRC